MNQLGSFEENELLFDISTQQEVELISELLGKTPQGEFRIVVRKQDNEPVVIENAPFFFDGTPMPTRFWLVDKDLIADVSRVESFGGVKRVQEEIDEETIAQIHSAHSLEREKMISKDHVGPRPSGGVGGTRKGVKCLHTHVANYLATGDDAVGQWTMNEIIKMKAQS